MRKQDAIDTSAYRYQEAILSPSGEVTAHMITERNLLSFLFRRYKVRKMLQKDNVSLTLAGNMIKLGTAIDYGLRTDVRDMKGRGLLDLGCGSSTSALPDQRDYEPWLCRALFALGGKVTGVDIGDNSKEVFQHHQIDLTDPTRLEIFDDESYQIVHTHQVVGWGAGVSPILGQKVNAHLLATDPAYRKLNNNNRPPRCETMIDDIRTGIARQAARILLINGLFSIDDGIGCSSIYEKVGSFDPTRDPLADGGCLEKVL